MTNPEMWALIVGFFIPPILAVIQQPTWPDWFRATVTFLTAIVVGLGTLYFAGNLDFSNQERVVSTILLVFVTAIATYGRWWKPTGIAPRIEAATSPGDDGRVDRRDV